MHYGRDNKKDCSDNRRVSYLPKRDKQVKSYFRRKLDATGNVWYFVLAVWVIQG